MADIAVRDTVASFVPASTERQPKKAAGSIFSRFGAWFMDMQYRRIERELGRTIQRQGGLFNDETERRMARRMGL